MPHVARRTTEELPRSTVEALNRASLLASSPFLALWRTWSGRPVHWCHESDGGAMTLLTGVELGSGVLTRFQSMPDGLATSCVTVAGDTVAPTEGAGARAILDAIARHPYFKTWLFDFDGILPAPAPFRAREHETHVIDVSSPDWEPPDATLRSEIRKAEREHIEVVPFAWDEHGPAFMDLSSRTEQRHGRTSRYSAEYYRGLAELARTDERIVWKYCSHEGKPAASHIYLVERSHALYWQVSFDKAFSRLKPNQYMLFHTIRELQPRGVTAVSLGATPEDAEGLRAYKERWGGQPHRYRHLYRASWLGKAVGG